MLTTNMKNGLHNLNKDKAMTKPDKTENQSIFNKITFLWLLGLLTSLTVLHVGVRTQKYNVARLGSFGIIATVPFGARIFLPRSK